MLVNGQWSAEWHPVQATDKQGGFVRQTSSFRHWISHDGSTEFAAEPDRYHLYVALICPWASRTLIARSLKGLQSVISVSVVEPQLGEQGWGFGDYPGANRDTLNGARYLHELYTRAAADFTGRATVPVLWDKKLNTIVNNESADILRMLNSGFGTLADDRYDLYPAALQQEIDALNDRIYPRLNNGVYRTGFATTQQSYQQAFTEVFSELDDLEARLSDGRTFLFGEHLTETDIRLFVTLVRFDVAYHGLFKCNLRRLHDYPRLSRYLKSMLAVSGVRETVNIDHIKQGYYSIKALNPNGIVPVGPDMSEYGLQDTRHA
ncbi:glutathione S-transferase family protein [Candidatus Pantoea multigeneris]|uniref:Glutathione S-transferase family protein n=1 Tax=Candidatus Pantoea multigeneris TaxID=2608357 RepID=A0ABX0RG63_9GAMM|nr:glutathione S-transferase family protein [Pantoea multigeneris]NIF24322.1 glutathione S-transferase family protein [Pantoea multigeneris]